ncbi:autotransporter outer membrane beta-barrel domain-containing protein [Polynucleobacter paneuropaeus]|nr:autotransporter outer membrane beta-barrel domain-containing protein [Polynucleobacter paneuropaeus]
MKSLPFIASKQSNKFCISAREGAHLLLSLFAALSISFAGNGLAQTLSGGAGGNNNAFLGPQGGLSTVSDFGGSGSDGGSGSAAGGGGGGAGITGGNGGGSGGAVGGTGGSISNGGGGGGGAVGSDSGGGGGGGGGVGANVTTTSANSGPLSGGGGGGGGTGSACCATGSGGGGGAGGFGAIVNSAGITYTNSGSIVGGNGGDGGAANSIAGPALANGGNGGSGGVGVYLGNLTTLINSGTVTGGAGGAGGAGPSGGTNAIAGPSAPGVYVASGISVTEITNTGTITGGTGSYSIQNAGTITTLNNLQGAGNAAGALTYSGPLPTNYNIIINSPTSFGKLDATGGHSGTMNFGIYAGGIAGVPASVLSAGTYKAVLIGFQTPVAFNNITTGKYGSYTWNLVIEADSAAWDLVVTGGPLSGPSVANTNQSIVNTASALQGTYTLQNSVLANSFSYDCTVFGANDVCVSAGGRNTQVQAANGLNNTSALLIAAYRPHPNYRIGAYADQNLSVSNPGGTVNLGNNTPLLGLFAAWNERLDGTGTEVKVSAAYGQKNTTINRSVVGSGSTASEAGSGSSTLNSQGAQVTAKYGFSVLPEVIVSPYVGVRYTQNNMGGYTESTSSSVTAPLTYSALNTNATTALAGVGASYRVIPTVMTFASAGVETDTNTANGTYSATNASIGTLTPINFNPNPVKTRPTATVGAYYDVAKNQRLGITGIYRQEAYQAVSTTTVLATYTIGL